MIFSEPFEPIVRHNCPIIGIGASAGGLEAVNETLSAVTDRSRFAFIIIQHLDPNHISMMAELMDRRTDLEVRQIEGGETVRAGHAYVIPPGKTLNIKDGELTLESFDEPRGVRRPIDDFFFSLASDQGQNAACVVLSGTGTDGADGLRAIKERGGVAVAQKPNTAKFDGMPMAAISTGLVDFILAPDEIFDRLKAFFDSQKGITETESPSTYLSDHITPICAALKKSVGHDFSGYKRSTLTRRIMRRMHVLEIDEASEYLSRLMSDDRECEALLRDLTINVTSFYRDSESWDVLTTLAITDIVASVEDGGTIRAWVAGCSSGQEAYTLAMLLAEEIDRVDANKNVQIFATDIDNQMLSQAREGHYSLGSLKNLPAKLRETYVFASEGYFEITARIRSMVQFSNHSIIKNPPFSKLDLISCRNLLIYLGDDIQNAIIPLFHYALKPNRYLFLGGSETIGRHENLFETINQKTRLFRRRPGKAAYPLHFPLSDIDKIGNVRSKPMSSMKMRNHSIADQRLLSSYSPNYILVDEHGDIVRSGGKLSKYLEFPTGVPTNNLKSLARKDFKTVLVPLMRKALDSGKRHAVQNVEIRSDFGVQKIDIIVDPLPDFTTLIILPEVMAFRVEVADDVVDVPNPIDQAHDLEEELRLTRFRLRSTVEELETANEELKSSNEEMMSMNEELQSSNEELSTVNEELKTKADQLTVVNTDMKHFIESTELALVILDSDMKVRNYTSAIEDVFPLKTVDRGRLLSEVVSFVDDDRIIDGARSVMVGGPPIQRLVIRSDGTQSFSMRITPYYTEPNSIDGATITFTDVSQLQNAEIALQNQSERLRLAITAAEMGIWDFDIESGVTNVDAKIREFYNVPTKDVMKVDDFIAAIYEPDRERVSTTLTSSGETLTPWRSEFRIQKPDGSILWLQGVGKTYTAPEGRKKMFGVNFDITAQKEAVDTRDLLIREMNHRVKNLFSVVSSMVALAAKSEDNVEEMARKVKSQIWALGHAHNISYHEEPTNRAYGLEELFNRILAPFAETNNIRLQGERIDVTPDVLTPLSLVLHEWATNALKYGCLSHPEGSLTLTWDYQPGSDEDFVIQWYEQGLHDITKPEAEDLGFGSRLLDLSAMQLEGSITSEWGDRHVSHRLTLPVRSFKNVIE